MWMRYASNWSTRVIAMSVKWSRRANSLCAAAWWICSRWVRRCPTAWICLTIRLSRSRHSMWTRSARCIPCHPCRCCPGASIRPMRWLAARFAMRGASSLRAIRPNMRFIRIWPTGCLTRALSIICRYFFSKRRHCLTICPAIQRWCCMVMRRRRLSNFGATRKRVMIF